MTTTVKFRVTPAGGASAEIAASGYAGTFATLAYAAQVGESGSVEAATSTDGGLSWSAWSAAKFYSSFIGFDTTTQTALQAATTRFQWAEAIQSAIAIPKRLRLIKDGAEVFVGQLSGGNTLDFAANIVDWGTVITADSQSVASIDVGVWKVRIEGGSGFSRFIEMPIGDPGNDPPYASLFGGDFLAGVGVLISLTLASPLSLPLGSP